MSTPLLEARSLVTGFGSNQVLHGIDFDVAEGEIVGIFGLNGAGKSVMMKTLSGLQPLWSGEVHYAGERIDGLTPEARVRRGISNVPQGRQVFPDLTVEENLRLGAYTTRRRDRGAWTGRLDRVYDQFPILADRRDELGGTLSGGQAASLAVARALVNEPRLLLIDEPSAGLAPLIVGQLLEILQAVAATGMTMVLIEQNVRFGLQLVDRATILQTGRVVYAGRSDELDQDRVASLLGIGRMLSSAASATLRSSGDGTSTLGPRPRRRRPLSAPANGNTP